MELISLYSELQVNPKNTRVYRRLVDYYKSHNMPNEAAAFEALLKDKSERPDSPSADEEQRSDD